jgi:hypothetical protein
MNRILLAFPLLLAACGGDDGGGSPDGCLDADVLATLDAHAESLRFSGAMLAGHPGAREAIGFFTFPGLEVQRGAVYAGPLIMECSEPLQYDEFCEEDGLCSQIECTGAGTSWEFHFWLADPVSGDISYETASVDTAWAEGDTGITFTSASQAIGADDRDWSFTGTGAMDVDAIDVEETYAGLIDGSVVVLTVSDDSEGNHGGAITIDGELAAEPDADGTYTAVEACR